MYTMDFFYNFQCTLDIFENETFRNLVVAYSWDSDPSLHTRVKLEQRHVVIQ